MSKQFGRIGVAALAMAVAGGILTPWAVAQDTGTSFFPTVTITASDPYAGEAGTNTGTFMVVRHIPKDTPPPDTSLIVFYRVSGTASNGADYQSLSGSVTIPPLALGATITVAPNDDDAIEGEETVVVQITGSPLACATCGYNIGVPSNAVVVIADNDRPTPTNHPPEVRLNSPQTGELFTAPATIVLRAYAQDAEDGYELKVEFFEGVNSLGVGTFVPTLCPAPYCPFYALMWSNVPPGDYILTAKATDRNGASSVSDPVHIRVIPSVNIYATDPVASEHPAISGIPPDTATFTVRRSGETNIGIVVYYEISGTASNGVDYQKLTGEVTIPEGAWSAEIVVDPIDDNLVEDTETVSLTLIPPCPPCLFTEPPCLPPVPIDGSCYPIGPDNRAVAYIRDNDSPTETNHPPSVRLIAPQDGDAFVAPADIRLVAFAQDAEDGYLLKVEFFEGAHSLGFGTFFPGRCAVCPNYGITWSNVPSGEYTLTAKATDKDGATTTSEPVRILVREPTTTQPVVNIVATDPEASEIPEVPPWLDIPQLIDPAVFTVTRTGGDPNVALDVFYHIGGTASNGVDYAKLSGTVTIPAGERSAVIEVDPIDDKLAEGTESVVVALVPPVCIAIFPPPPDCYIVGPSNRAVAFIRDDDFERSNLPPAVHIVKPANGELFAAPADVHIVVDTVDADGYVPHVDFFANDHKIGEQTINFIIAPPPGQHIEFDIVWSNVPPGRYVLTAKGTDDQGAMTVSALITISVVETNLPPPTNLPPVVTIVASDAFASEGTVVWVSNQVWGTSIWGSNTWWRTNCTWGTNTAAFAVRRSGGTNDDLTVYYATSGTASNGVDYEKLSGVLTIPAGHRSARILVMPIDDALPEKIETVILALQLPPSTTAADIPPYVIGRPGKAAAIIVDNDLPRPPCIRLSDGLFHMCQPGTNGFCHRIEASSDLVHWVTICTNTVTDDAIHFVDPEASDFPHRFYRAVPEAIPPEE